MIKGWSWTTTHYEDVTGNPDGSITKNVRVQGEGFSQPSSLGSAGLKLQVILPLFVTVLRKQEMPS